MPYHGSRMSGQNLAMRFEYHTPLGLLGCNSRYLQTFLGKLMDQFVLIWTEQQEKNSAQYCTVIITWFVLRNVRRIFRSEFSRECDLLIPLSISSTFSLPSGHSQQLLTSSSSSFPPVYLCFNNVFWKAVPKRKVTSPVFLFLLHLGCFISPWLYMTYLFFSHNLSNWFFQTSLPPNFKTNKLLPSYYCA
jgi:hypothetical protein